ncbi:MAG: hypothetical protein ACK55Z_08950, partial [bacterium]
MGADVLENGLGNLSFVDLGRGRFPKLSFTRPEFVQCTTYHEAPRDLNSCTAYYSLNPGESGEFDFYLNKAAQVIRRDQILITACQLEYIAIS